MATILVGTCSWAEFTEWYPAGVKPSERIRYYAQHFPVVEIDSTFYHLMPRRNFEGWAEKTPEGFVFDVKAHRTLTRHGAAYEPGKVHADADPEYDPSEDDFEKFKYQIEPLREKGKLRAIQFQFPPWFKRSPASLEHIEVCREYLREYLMAVEFRHHSWLEPAVAHETFAFLRDRDIVYTVVDEPQIGSASVPPLVAVTNPDLAIVRFHGRNAETWYLKGGESSRERFKYLYTTEELSEWAPKITEMANQACEVHVLMNNNYSSNAITNAQEMQQLLAGG
jgi:uncharacterized protein YecE (DUF72 family)